jgi:hypothetical protein
MVPLSEVYTLHRFRLQTPHSQISLVASNQMGRVIVFNATFNNISVISWRSVLLVEETGVPGENNLSAASN